MMRFAVRIALAICAIGSASATALAAPRRPAKKPAPARQPAPPPSTPDADPAADAPAKPADASDKLDARALMQSGLKLFAAKDFLGALAVFRTAYTRFPSAKILLNIGTTLTRLDRKADAANVYQHYLDSADADPARRAEVAKVLADLDAAVAVIEPSITPRDAELQFNDEDWVPAASEPRHRVAPGPFTLRARHSAYKPGERTVTTTAGAHLPVALALIEIPPEPVAPPRTALAVDGGLRATAEPSAPRSRIGALAMAHIDFAHPGAAGLVGATADLTDRLQAQVAVILGASYGGYAGASYAITGGAIRPIVAAGVPIFGSGGARVALRGAGGVELAVNRHLAVIAELGVEYFVNPEPDVSRTLFIPAIGAAGRL
jgi:tetratricopeptide (TPR) repeat protein